MRTTRPFHGNGTLLFAVEARRQLAAGDPRRAIETCKMGLARHPDHAAGYVVLAAAYRAAGQDDRSRLVLLRGFERTGLESLRAMAAETGVEPESPEVEKTEVEKTEVERPEVEKPEVEGPEVEKPEVETPKVEKPEVERPEVERPEVEKPETETLETEKPEIEGPETEKPETEKPEIDRSGVEGLQSEKPQTEEPATEEPATEEPETEKPEIDRPIVEEPEVTESDVSERRVSETEVAELVVEEHQVAEHEVERRDVEEHETVHAPLAAAMAEATEVDLLEAEEKHSPLELVEEREDETVPEPHATPDERAPEIAHAAPGGGLSVLERSAERVPWFQHRGPRTGDRARASTLALHSGKSAHRLTSANLRLIPGLEFAPLRAEEPARRLMFAPIMEDPLPEWEPRRRPSGIEGAPPLPEYPDVTTAIQPTSENAATHDERTSIEPVMNRVEPAPGPPPAPPSPSGPTSIQDRSAAAEPDTSALDELAKRLEGARIAPIGEAPATQRQAFEPSIVSDTLAEILVSQGAYGEALKAFMTLARMRPAKLKYYEERIDEMKRFIVVEREVEE